MDADIDAAAEDPPVTWVAVAVLGLVVAATGIVAIVLNVVGISGTVVATVPVLWPLFEVSPLVLVFGIGLFLLAMTEWSPEIEK